MKIATWNVNGWRAISKSGWMERFLKEVKPDVVCLQEIKLSSDQQMNDDFIAKLGYVACANVDTTKKGYSGTAVLYSGRVASQIESVTSLPVIEGRVQRIKFVDGTVAFNVYTPNSGQRGLARLEFRVSEWDPMFRALAKKKLSTPTMVLGDLNVARFDIDIHNPKGNTRSAGFTVEERDSFEKLLKEARLRDAWREAHPKEVGYTYWSYISKARQRNAGWRIDYVLTRDVSVKSCEILSEYCGSDHAPVICTLES